MSTSETTAADYLLLRELLAGVLEEYLKGPVPERAELKSVEGGLTDAHRRWLMLLELGADAEALRP